MKTPIVFFAYNRPEHTREALQALLTAKYADETDLYIFCDGAKNPDEELVVKEVQRICNHTSGFANVTVEARNQNIGLSANIIDGVGRVIDKYGRVIVIEDDLQVSPSFLKYMNAALDFYEDKGVFSISGYMPPIDIPNSYQYSSCLINRISSWGWATWKSKWDKVDWDVNSFADFIVDKSSRKAFNKAGNDLSMMLLKQQQNIIKSWAIRFCYAGFCQGELSVYPITSLVSNYVADGSGTNMRRSSKYSTSVIDTIDVSLLAPASVKNEHIESRFKRFYDVSPIRR